MSQSKYFRNGAVWDQVCGELLQLCKAEGIQSGAIEFRMEPITETRMLGMFTAHGYQIRLTFKGDVPVAMPAAAAPSATDNVTYDEESGKLKLELPTEKPAEPSSKARIMKLIIERKDREMYDRHKKDFEKWDCAYIEEQMGWGKKPRGKEV